MSEEESYDETIDEPTYDPDPVMETEDESYVKSVANEPNSDKVCIDCNKQSDYLIYGLFKSKPGFTCMKCLFNKIIETGTEQFYNDSKEYKGMFFDYQNSFDVKS